MATTGEPEKKAQYLFEEKLKLILGCDDNFH